MKKLTQTTALLVVGVFLLLSHTVARATLITFDGIGGTEGTAVGTIEEATFSNAIFAQPGDPVYAFGGSAGNDTLLGGAPVGGLFITDSIPGGGDFADPSGPIVVDFSVGVTDVSFYILDVDFSNTELFTLTIEDSGGIVDQIIFSENPAGDVLGGGTVSLTRGDALATLVDFNNTTAITRLIIAPSNAAKGRYGFGVDNLSYSVPEPSTLAFLGIALLALGLLHRRRRVSAT